MTFAERRLSGAAVPWLVAACLGVVHAAGWAFASNPDGISYLHLADFFARGDWGNAADAVWSPGYPALMGFAFRVFRPSAYWELPVVHAVNFVCYLIAFAAFRFFLRALIDAEQKNDNTDTKFISFSEPAASICLHVIFFAMSLCWVGLRIITPDMLVVASVFAAAGVALRALDSDRNALWFALGVVAGVGYLIKAVMFPLGLLLLAAASISRAPIARMPLRFVLALIGFLTAGAPQIIAVSKIVGAPAYSGAGGMVYAKNVNGYPMFWTGSPPGSGTPKHPIQIIHSNPDAFEYLSADATSSYPFWDRPGYWNEGLTSHFDLRRQIAVMKPILVMYADALALLLFVIVVVFLLSTRRLTRKYLFLIVTSLGAFGLYALVYAETRYLAAWALILFACAVSSFRFTEMPAKSLRALFVTLAIFQAVYVVNQTRLPFSKMIHLASQGSAGHTHYVIASKLASLGLRPGDHVAAVGYAFDGYWARIAKAQIAMEAPDFNQYWSASDSARNEVNNAFSKAGAVAIVANRVPETGPGKGWIPLGVEDYYYLKLK